MRRKLTTRIAARRRRWRGALTNRIPARRRRWRGALTRTEVRAAVVAVFVARTAVNGSMRIVYPFLPEIARGLGVSLSAVGGLLALRSMAGLTAPLVPRLSETLGRRAVMTAGLVATVAGCLALAGAPGLVAAAVGFVCVGLAKPLFDIPMQGWFGSRVPYERRGRVLGTTELTWALSLLLAVPSGFLIARISWRAPFVLVAILAVAGLVTVRRLMAPDRPAQRIRKPLRWTRPRLVILGVALLFRVATEMLFVVYGVWLEDDFGLSVAAIGVFTLVVVGAELAGEGAVAAFSDRLGLRRSILFGLTCSTVAYASLGLVGSSLPAAIVVVVAWFTGFEITIVSTIPFITALGAESRERLLSAVAMVTLAAGGVGAVVAPPLYRFGGITACGVAAAACAVVAGLLLWRLVPSPAAV